MMSEYSNLQKQNGVRFTRGLENGMFNHNSALVKM